MKSYSDPRMHTAEHLLNAAMVDLIGTDRSFSAHIEKKKSKADYRFDRDLTDEEVKAVEERVQACITEDIPVTEEFFQREEAEQRFSLRKLPESAGDTIRIVRIGEYDAVPCIGEHVPSTGEIGNFSITSRSFSDNVLRLRFKAG
jgi:alanyl-tRNA synthetase